MMVISVEIFGYKIKYAFQMAKCINTEFETLVTRTINYLRTWMCCSKKDPRKVQVSSICNGRMKAPYRGKPRMCHAEMLSV